MEEATAITTEQQTTEATTEQKAEPTFDDILASNKAFQAEFDRRMNKGQETARQKWEAEAKAQADEAAKLAKMKAEEKAEYERQKREEALTKREAEITRRELHAEAAAQLIEDGLPAELADIIDCTSADNCKQSMETVKKAFAAAVEKAVNNRIKGSGTLPKAAVKVTGDSFLEGLGS